MTLAIQTVTGVGDPQDPGVVETVMPVGLTDGTIYASLGGWDIKGPLPYQEIYLSCWVRLGTSDYENHANGTTLGQFGVGQFNTARNQGLLIATNPTNSQGIVTTYKPQFWQQGPIQRKLDTGVLSSTGGWHHWEFICKLDTQPANDPPPGGWIYGSNPPVGGSADGVFQWFIDDVLVANKTDMVWRTVSNNSGFYYYKWEPIWGPTTTGSKKTRTDYIFFDHVKITGLLATDVGATTTDTSNPATTGTNEPVGFTPIVECAFGDSPATASETLSTANMLRGMRDVSTSVKGFLALDTTQTGAPKSPPNVWKQKYPTGFAVTASEGPIVMWQTGDSASGAMSYRKTYVRLHCNMWGQGTGDFEMMKGGCGGVLKWFYLPTGDTSVSHITMGWKGIDGSGSPALTSSRPVTVFFHRFGNDGTASGTGSASEVYCSIESFPATTWLTVEALMVCNSLPSGGSDPAPSDGTFEAWINGIKVTWLNVSSTVNYGTRITGLRQRSYLNPRGTWRYHQDSVYGGGSAGNKTRDDYVLWDHVYVSVAN